MFRGRGNDVRLLSSLVQFLVLVFPVLTFNTQNIALGITKEGLERWLGRQEYRLPEDLAWIPNTHMAAGNHL